MLTTKNMEYMYNEKNLLDVWVIFPQEKKKQTNAEKRWMNTDILLLDIAQRAYGWENGIVNRKNEDGSPSMMIDQKKIYIGATHSKNWSFLAFSHTPVGIDAECFEENDAHNEKIMGKIIAIAKRYFSPREQKTLAKQAPTKKIQTFFQWWTIKEAFVKSSGIPLLKGIKTAVEDIPRQWTWQYCFFNEKNLDSFRIMNEQNHKIAEQYPKKRNIALSIMWENNHTKSIKINLYTAGDKK